MARTSESAKVLITVKAAPQPSEQYGDTVCVAGIRIDGGRAEWIRLYPMPFRWMGVEQQFKKFDVVELNLHRATKDPRPESYRPELESIRIVENLSDAKDRHAIVSKLPETTTCELSAHGAESGAPSLGFVPVKSLDGFKVEAFAGWSDAQKRRIAQAANLSPLEMFGDGAQAPAELRAPRFVARYRYHCRHASCSGHVGQILDWELTALQGHLHAYDDEGAKAEIEKKFVSEMFNRDRETSFFMGNFEAAQKRRSFSVLSVYRPRRKDTVPPAPMLF